MGGNINFLWSKGIELTMFFSALVCCRIWMFRNKTSFRTTSVSLPLALQSIALVTSHQIQQLVLHLHQLIFIMFLLWLSPRLLLSLGVLRCPQSAR